MIIPRLNHFVKRPRPTLSLCGKILIDGQRSFARMQRRGKELREEEGAPRRGPVSPAGKRDASSGAQRRGEDHALQDTSPHFETDLGQAVLQRF